MPATDRVVHPGQDDNSRKLSPSLWRGLPALADVLADPELGWAIYDDFVGSDEGLNYGWVLTQATTGTAAVDTTAATEGGVLLLDSNSTTDGQGPQIQLSGANFKPQANHVIVFETRVKTDEKENDFAFGLAAIDTTWVAGSDVTTANHVCFQSLTDDGVILPEAEKAGASDVNATVHTFVDDTYVKLGFRIEGTSKIRWFVNGAEKTGVEHPTAAVPIVGMVPSFTVHSAGTEDPILHIDWVACAQFTTQL